MVDIRELRLSIERKLNDRRRLIAQNAELRLDRDNMAAIVKSEVLNFVLEDCADQIINQVLDEAIGASTIVADRTIDNGDYVIGISIPSFHIRHRVARHDAFNWNSPNDPITNEVKILHIGKA